MPKQISELGEFGLIDLFSKDIKTSRLVVRGIGDDTAVIRLKGDGYQLLTCDMLIEGKHFAASADHELVGQKAINCNISDVAAMGGKPRFAVISLGAKKNTSIKKITALYQGIKKACNKWGVEIVGGDTVESQQLVINVAMAGEVRKRDLVLRSTAKKGDYIFVTGYLGKSLLSGKHLKFEPRVKESQYLVKNFRPTSMIDISDGLAADLGHILKASKKGAVLDEAKIPLASRSTVQNALYDGEDFELLFTMRPKGAERLIANKNTYKFYPIGRITGQLQELMISDQYGKLKKIKISGFDHFKK